VNTQSKKFKAGRGYALPIAPHRAVLDPILLHDIQAGTIVFNSNEFTSLCPLTDQPDFAVLQIRFTPKAHTLESKSLKLYLHAFRNYKGFAEDINLKILNDIFETIEPDRLEVNMHWHKRGGIEIETSFWR